MRCSEAVGAHQRGHAYCCASDPVISVFHAHREVLISKASQIDLVYETRRCRHHVQNLLLEDTNDIHGSTRHVDLIRALSAASHDLPRPPTTFLFSSHLTSVSRMLFTRLPALLLTAVLLPSFAEAGLFYKSSPVKMLDAKSFKKAMRENVRLVFIVNTLFSILISDRLLDG